MTLIDNSKRRVHDTDLNSPPHALKLCFLQPHSLSNLKCGCVLLSWLGETQLGKLDIPTQKMELNCSIVILQCEVSLPHHRVTSKRKT